MVADSRRVLISSLLLSIVVSGGAPVVSGQGLPAGEGLEIVSAVCTQCHGLDYLAQASGKLTRVDWENALYDMIARGAPVEEKDREILLKYLQDNLASK